MTRPGFILFTLRTGERLDHVPSHLDHLSGAARPAGILDRGPLDRIINRWGGGGRCTLVYYARKKFGRPGEQHTGFDDSEENLGMSRTYKLRIAEPDGERAVIDALRALRIVEAAGPLTLATAPQAAPAEASAADLKDAWAPREQIRLKEAHAMEQGDERVTTAVVDTGIVVGHPEFQRKCLAGYDTVDLGMGKLSSGMRLVGDSRGHDYNPYDDVGHGCLVAGVIGAQGWRIPRGAGGRTLILAVRVLAAAMGETPKRVGVGALTDIDCGIKIAVDLGASVINMSFGTPASSLDGAGETPHKRVIRYAAGRGCVLIAAAGNSGAREQYYPAALPEVIAVASVDRSGRRSRFSTWGDHVCISAPGERIVSAGRRGYTANSGTSFAAPFVSGVASLLVSRARRHGKHIPASMVRSILVDSASALGGGGFHPETGHGLLNAAAAIRLLDRRLG